MEPRVDGADRDAEALGDRVARLPLELVEDEDRASLEVERVEGALNPGERFLRGGGLERRRIRRDRGVDRSIVDVDRAPAARAAR